MADDYVDYLEVSEYGAHFVEEAKKLVDASPLVAIEALIGLVSKAMEDVETELEKAGVKRGDLRGGRSGVEAAAETTRKEIERFYNYLGSLDDEVAVDRSGFFPGEKLGALAALKPGDVKSKADEVLRGFSVAANAALPDRPKWEGKLTSARDALAGALSGKGSAAGLSIQSTAGLIAARERFLTSYNSVAKPILRGLLAHLGREGELKQFFKDLQVNERAPAKKAAPAKGDDAGSGETKEPKGR